MTGVMELYAIKRGVKDGFTSSICGREAQQENLSHCALAV